MSEQTPTPPAFTAAAAKKSASKKTAKKKSAAKKTTAKKLAAKKKPTSTPSKKVSAFKHPQEQDFYAVLGNINVLTQGLERVDPINHPKMCVTLKEALTVQVYVLTELTRMLFPNLDISKLIDVAGDVAIIHNPQPSPLVKTYALGAHDVDGTVVSGTPEIPIPVHTTTPVPIVG